MSEPTKTANENLLEKLNDAETPGYQAEFDPDEAEEVGAFLEDALSEDDAVDSVQDWDDEEPGFLEDDGTFLEPPTFITRAPREK